MKKILFFALCLVAVVACDTKKSDTPENDVADSLKRVIVQKDNEINDMVSTLNEIQDGFRQISAAENRITIAKDGEGTSRAETLREDIKFVAETMARNRDLIAKLQKQAREGSIAAEQLKKTIENLTAELAEKGKELEQLRAELQEKDIRIAELDQTVTNLNTDVANLRTESAEKSSTIKDQDTQLNTAWYVFGTKKELKAHNILSNGDVLRNAFDKNYFIKIDIRNEKEIKFYSRSAKILTTHPSSSYTLQPNAQGQYYIRINDPQSFWSTSKYLVVMVK